MLCALALVLLLDASGSVPDRAWDMQVQAHADALADPAIGRIIARDAPVAVMVVGFDDTPRTLVSWRLLEGPGDALALAHQVAGARRPGNGMTATGRALAFALEELRRAPCVADRQVIDLVTDGPGDDAAVLARARAEAEARDVRVNALAVETYPGGDPATWLRHQVVTAGGFVMQADGWADVAAALRRKITWEISGR
jgi:hypothetical protein